MHIYNAHMCLMEYYSAMKNGILPLAVMWMKIDTTIFTEI